MGDCFHGWPQKAGVFTLILACVCAMGWLRSQSTLDVIKIPIGGSTYCHCYSGTGECGCSIVSGRGLSLSGLKWDTTRIDDRFSVTFTDIPIRCPIIFYWSVVIPLALVSVLLLLFKPRSAKPRAHSSNPKKPIDPYHEYLETGWLFFLAFDSRFDSRKAS